MDAFLAVEIIEDVGFAESCLRGDLVQRGPAIAVAGKYIQCGIKDDTSVALLDAAWLLLGILWHWRSPAVA